MLANKCLLDRNLDRAKALLIDVMLGIKTWMNLGCRVLIKQRQKCRYQELPWDALLLII